MISNPSYQNFATFDKSEYPHLWNGVVGAWCPSLGPTGTRLHDVSGKGNWGTLTNMDNATDWVIQSGQYSLRFDGTNKSVSARFITSALIGTGFAMSCWVRNMTIPVSDGSPFANGVDPLFFINSGKVDGYWAGGTRVSGVTTVTGRAAWTLLGMCWNGTQAQIYIDGRLDATGNTTAIPGATSGTLLIGQYASNRTIAGDVDDCTIWSRALSPNEWRQLYQLGRGGMYTPRRRRKVSVQVGNAIWLKTGGVWKETIPWIKVGGVWKQASPNIKISGTWK